MSPLSRLRHWLERLRALPIADPVERRMGRVFQAILFIMLGVELLAIAAFGIPGHTPLIPFLANPRADGLMLATTALMIVLLRRYGRFRLGIVVVIGAMLALFALFAYQSRLVEARAFLLFCIPIALSALLPRPAVFVVAGLSIAIIGAALGWQDASGVVPRAARRLVSFTLITSLYALIIDQISANYRRAVDEALARASDVGRKNEELEEANERLREAIAERERAEAELAQARKMEGLGVMAAGVAHDFNNLLSVILGNAELAKLQAAGSPIEGRLQEILGAGEFASDLCQQLMQFAGDSTPALAPMSLNEAAEEMASRVRPLLPEGARIELRLGEGLPPIRGDATQLRQVVMNLLANARDALEGRAGRIVLETGLGERSEGELAGNRTRRRLGPGLYEHLSVEDDGCGMDATTMAKIFDPFYTTKAAGHGLGLAAALGIVRTHHAGVYVESRLGGGTRFTLLFPVGWPADERRTETPAA